ncbi:hypothetical protein, partial [Methanosarcina sp. 2.H.T.1A.15]|uniref:hypothetical protein n=1 Tax=Methanosarcina sp. 2.H.T.1A.15 TaxID=1483596 RepID=UPI00064E6C7B
DGIRDCLLSRGLGDVYKRQHLSCVRDTYKAFLVYKAFPHLAFFKADPTQNEILLEPTKILQLQSPKIGSG